MIESISYFYGGGDLELEERIEISKDTITDDEYWNQLSDYVLNQVLNLWQFEKSDLIMLDGNYTTITVTFTNRKKYYYHSSDDVLTPSQSLIMQSIIQMIIKSRL